MADLSVPLCVLTFQPPLSNFDSCVTKPRESFVQFLAVENCVPLCLLKSLSGVGSEAIHFFGTGSGASLLQPCLRH